MSSNTAQALRTSLFAGITAATALVWAPPGETRVTRIVIDSTEPIAGQPYQELTGRAWGELDPRSPKNALITDIKAAPKNARGKVEYVTSFRIRKPTDMSLSSGLMWHDVPNRGGNVNLTNDLFAAGDLQLLSGWQGDNSGATRLPENVDCRPPYLAPCAAPVFVNHYVKTPVLEGVTGKILARIINRSGPGAAPLNVMGNPIPYFPVDETNNAGDTMTIVTHETINGKVTVGGTVPSSDWKYCGGGTFDAPLPVTELPVQVCLKGGFDPAKLYQLVYRVKDPYVLGVGTAAFRDVQSFFRYAANDDHGTQNPVGGSVRWAIIRGSSQSGNFTRHYIHLGMNEDEAGRIVHEGAWPLIAGRRVANNSRWGQPDGVLELYQMGSEGPQWWAKASDKVRDLPRAGILDRCRKTHTCPKVIETFGGAEVFALKMTMSWVGTSADRDIPLPGNVRRYYLPSSTHGGGNGQTTENPAAAGAVNCPGNNWGKGTLRANPVPATGLVNRMRAALRDWVMLGTTPPPSQWPTLEPLNQHDGRNHDWDDDDDDDRDGHHGKLKHGDGRQHDGDDDDRKARHDKWRPLLVRPTMKAMGFPKGIPGIPESIFKPENFVFPVFDYDWGPRYDHSEASGIPTNAPPPIRHVIKTLVPRVDKDGNELGGVPTVQNDAPLGTYLGWNITAGPGDVGYDNRPFHAGQLCNYVGGMVPFFKTKAQRLAAGDPRRSLEERYGTHAGYVVAVTRAADNAYQKGYLLAADRDALIQQAIESDVCNQPGDGGMCNPAAN
jgi:hypothetical protein